MLMGREGHLYPWKTQKVAGRILQSDKFLKLCEWKKKQTPNKKNTHTKQTNKPIHKNKKKEKVKLKKN